MLWGVYHEYDVDGGVGDSISKRKFVGVVEASEEEMKHFLDFWNRPRIYRRPYDDLYEHSVLAEKVELGTIETLIPYDPDTRLVPNVPESEALDKKGAFGGDYWDAKSCVWVAKRDDGSSVEFTLEECGYTADEAREWLEESAEEEGKARDFLTHCSSF